MPAYNAGKYVKEAIDSVLGQTYSHLELIVVNDGSFDNTAAELATYTDQRLTVITQSNKGQSAAANTAFKASKGELIKFMDADDVISPDYIAAQVNRLGTRRDALASASWGRFYNDDLSTFKPNAEDVWCDLPADEWLVRSWRRGSSMMQCALWLIPRDIVNKSGLWDEGLGLVNDLDFFTRVILSSKEIMFTPEAVLYYRSGIAGSLSDSKSAIAAASAYRSVDQATRNLYNVRQDGAARIACANTWQMLVYSLYPDHKELAKKGEERVKFFGGSDIPYQSAGIGALLLKFFNWKTLKQLRGVLKR